MFFTVLPKPQFRHITYLLHQSRLRHLTVLATKESIGPIHERNQRKRGASLTWTSAELSYSTVRNVDKEKTVTVAFETAPTEAEFGREVLEDVDPEMSNFSLKSLLYSEEEDGMIKELNHCKNHMLLFETIKKNASDFNLKQHVQSIILLWIFCHNGDTSVRTEILENPLIENLLCGLRLHIPHMDPNELGCSYLYLRKMNVPNTHIALQELLLHALDVVEETVDPLPLSALSRLVVGINTGQCFHVPTVCRNFIPHFVAHVNNCTTGDEARLLAICVLNLQRLISRDILDSFKDRLQHMLNTGALGAHTPKAVVKLLHMLNMPFWSHYTFRLVRELLLTLRTSINQLNDIELKTACRIFQHNLEPAGLFGPLKQATELQLLKHATPNTLTCYMPFAEPRNRDMLVGSFRRLLFSKESWQQPNAIGNLFTVLRGLKIADMRMCDEYWTGVLHELDSCPEEETRLRFLRHCHRYMNFNNNLGGTYRNSNLERRLSGMAMRTIDTDIASRIPVKFAQLAAFVLAYGHTPYCYKKFPNIILSKIISMAEQFSVMDCFIISRGLQIATEMRFRHHMPPILGMQIATIDNILVECMERHLSNSEGLTIFDLNGIVRSLGNRKTLKNTVVYQEALNKYKHLDYSDLNSRNVRDMAFNFVGSSFFVPEALDAMFNYIEQNQEHVMGETVEKILSCAYHLGYTPQSLAVLDQAATILIRDFNFMSGLSLVQACLALCYYKTIPDELINKVFCVHFIKRVEEEIQLCYSKATYPERVQNLIMQLNRTVCLDFPEANVPWFQQNYLAAHLSRKPSRPTQFSSEVENLLQTMLQDKAYFRCNHITPYGYQIDFVIHFDRDRKLIPEPVETTMLDRITKVAILLLKLDSFCENNLTALRGPDSLKIKHLEMMGYKVLHINEHDWNSKYMNVPGAKANYLKCLLQISN